MERQLSKHSQAYARLSKDGYLHDKPGQFIMSHCERQLTSTTCPLCLLRTRFISCNAICRIRSDCVILLMDCHSPIILLSSSAHSVFSLVSTSRYRKLLELYIFPSLTAGNNWLREAACRSWILMLPDADSIYLFPKWRSPLRRPRSEQPCELNDGNVRQLATYVEAKIEWLQRLITGVDQECIADETWLNFGSSRD